MVGGKRGVIIIARNGEEEEKKISLTGRYLHFFGPAPKEDNVFNRNCLHKKTNVFEKDI